jgi:outer membrane protein
MSKTNISIFLLLITVLIVQVSCKQSNQSKNQSATTSPADTTTGSSGAVAENSIVYVNIDTLMENYQYFKDSQKKLESQFESSQKQIDNKMQAMQQKYIGYQQKAQEMTRQQLEEAERTMGAEQEALLKSKEQLSKSLAKAEEDLNLQLRNKINIYLENLAKKNNYKFILSYNTTGLGMLYGDKTLDITQQVVKELNEAYLAEKGK